MESLTLNTYPVSKVSPIIYRMQGIVGSQRDSTNVVFIMYVFVYTKVH